MDSVKKVNFQDSSGAAIKEDGSLWIWGDIKRIGNGSIEKKEMSVPQKIMENVKDVKISRDTCLAIKEDGSLWNYANDVWGENPQYNDTPKKIMENVKSIYLPSYGAYNIPWSVVVIKQDNSLWMSTLEHNDFYSTTPKKIMENVKHMSCNV